MEIGLVSCTKSKLDHPATPGDLYTESPYFRKARTYAKCEHDTWYVLSAKHHLLEPDGPEIEPYDQSLVGASVDERRAWSEVVLEQLEDEGLFQPGMTLVIHAGTAYYSELLPLLPEGVTVEIPTQGLQFGETLAWYAEQLDG